MAILKTALLVTGTLLLGITQAIDTSNITKVICKNPSYSWAIEQWISEDITTLRKFEPAFGNYKAGACERVACEYSSAIYVCNDNKEDVFVHYSTMADYARYITQYEDDTQTACHWLEKHVQGSIFNEEVAWGQVFDKNGFNVIVGIEAGKKC